MLIGKTLSAAISALLAGSFAANAATVSKESGGVFVNAGTGFVELKSAAEVAPGQHVLVQPGGSASIAYAGNCTVRVGSGVWLVQPTPPCTNGATEIDFTTRMNQATPPTDPPGGGLIVGGVIVGAGIGVGILINQNQSDQGSSP